MNRSLILLALGTLMAAVSLAAIPDPVETGSGLAGRTSNTRRGYEFVPFLRHFCLTSSHDVSTLPCLRFGNRFSFANSASG